MYMTHSTPIHDFVHPVALLPRTTVFRAHFPGFPLCAEEDLCFTSESRSGLGRASEGHSWVQWQGLCLGSLWGGSVTESVMCDDHRTPRDLVTDYFSSRG